MELNNEIMLAVFEKYLANPIPISKQGLGRNKIAPHIPTDSRFAPDELAIHTLMFISEFVLEGSLITAFGTPVTGFTAIDYLSWSGRKLYEQLKRDQAQK